MRTATAAAAAVLLLFPLAAYAQPAGGATPPAPNGPMIVERMHSGFVVAPDVKVTQVDKTTSTLAGAYAGWLTDDTFFIGGGGYWLANQARDREMAYGGLVVQWLTRADRRIGFGAKGLVGGGQATLDGTILPALGERDFPTLPDLSRFGVDLDRLLRVPPTRVRRREGFFVAEPQIDVLVRLSKQLRLTAGAGYRLIDSEGHDDARLRGATGSIGLQISGGS
jgi:hypothetical protein